ncbi:SHOCT domain-containing protein [Nocardioides pacificus]
MGWYHDGIGWGGWLMMMLAMVAFWGLVVAAIITMFHTDTPAPHRSPQDLLDERLARGELTAEEYRALREALQETPRGYPVAHA